MRLREHLSSFPRPLKRILKKLEHGVASPNVPYRGHSTLKRPNHKLRPAELATLLADYQGGASINGLGRTYNLHEQNVRAHLERAGVSIRPWKALSSDELPAVIALYESGLSLRQVGAIYDVHNNTSVTTCSELVLSSDRPCVRGVKLLLRTDRSPPVTVGAALILMLRITLQSRGIRDLPIGRTVP